jgi:hypothetical protein
MKHLVFSTIRRSLFSAMKNKPLLILLLLALTFRFVGIEWDHGYGLHPDERMLIMVTERLTETNLNPDFFNYGNFPVYLLRFASWGAAWLSDPKFGYYAGIFLIGRLISIAFDLGTLLLVYMLGKHLWSEKIGLWSAFIYTTFVFAIQNAHFFTVDTQLTFWLTLTVYLGLPKANRSIWRKILLTSVTAGLAGATKITGLIGLLIPAYLIVKHFTQSIHKKTNQTHSPSQKLPPIFLEGISQALLAVVVTVTTFFATQPYALINFDLFRQQITEQLKMSSDATIFPYTIQFIPSQIYLTPLSDIARWGLGYPTAGLCLIGFILIVLFIKKNRAFPLAMVLGFYLIYFLLAGRSAVKFMRYFLPLYPFLALAGGYALEFISHNISQKNSVRLITQSTIVILVLIWPIAWMSIYLHPHTRATASNWLNENLPPGTTIASEHWDDILPLRNTKGFNSEILEVYQPDTNHKWNTLNNQLAKSDYLILSSSRVYRSILDNPQRYPIASAWYQALLSNTTDWKLFKEFTSYPRINLGPLDVQFNDDPAQESFTSYDHPRVMIFRRAR